MCLLFFFFNDTATTEIYTLSLHDALPIYLLARYVELMQLRFGDRIVVEWAVADAARGARVPFLVLQDRKSTRLNSSHANISYAVFCLKKKKTPINLISTSSLNHYTTPPQY